MCCSVCSAVGCGAWARVAGCGTRRKVEANALNWRGLQTETNRRIVKIIHTLYAIHITARSIPCGNPNSSALKTSLTATAPVFIIGLLKSSGTASSISLAPLMYETECATESFSPTKLAECKKLLRPSHRRPIY